MMENYNPSITFSLFNLNYVTVKQLEQKIITASKYFAQMPPLHAPNMC